MRAKYPVLCALLLFAALACRAAVPLIVCGDKVKLRSGNSDKSAVLETLNRGEQVEFLQSGEKTTKTIYDLYRICWIQVKSAKGTVGWVPSDALMVPIESKQIPNEDVPPIIPLKAKPRAFKTQDAIRKERKEAWYTYQGIALTEPELKLLREHGFYLRPLPPSGYIENDDMVDLYSVFEGIQPTEETLKSYDVEGTSYKLMPYFITSDYLLHVYHLLFMRMTENLEIHRLAPAMKGLTADLLAEAMQGMRKAKDPATRESYKRVAEYLAVPALAQGVPVKDPQLSGFANRMAAKMKAAKGFEEIPELGLKEDFSQYLPRGHYAKSKLLSTYFRAMIWFGRAGMPEKKPLDVAVLCSLIADPKHLARWESVYVPTAILVGRTDGPELYDYLKAYQSAFGTSHPADGFTTEQLQSFTAAMSALKAPAIVSTSVGPDPEARPERALPLMGQRFIPDSFAFTQLTSPRVGDDLHPRNMPKGLDVMALLGSRLAEDLLATDQNIPGYGKAMTSLKAAFEPLRADPAPLDTTYTAWLGVLSSLLDPPAPGLPAFTRSREWPLRMLVTTHGSWAELRHDTLLYAKQSYAESGEGGDDVEYVIGGQPYVPRGYVEPNPRFFERFIALVSDGRKRLDEVKALTEEYKKKLDVFEKSLRAFAPIAEKEANGGLLTEEEFLTICNSNQEIEKIVLPWNSNEVIYDQNQKRMALVSDVHTDALGGRVLEAGIGTPQEIYVHVNDQNGNRVCIGYVFSYYEFEQPMDARMKDEDWRNRVYDPKASPALKKLQPGWIATLPYAAH
jgi:hypothetical protein